MTKERFFLFLLHVMTLGGVVSFLFKSSLVPVYGQEQEMKKSQEVSQDQNKEAPDGQFIFLSQEKNGHGVLKGHYFSRYLPEKLSFKVKSEGKTLSIQGAEALPVHLRLYLDSSALCASSGMEEYINTLILALPKSLAAGSLVTVASFSRGDRYVFHNQVEKDQLHPINFHCQKMAPSDNLWNVHKDIGSSRISGLNEVLWVFSAGNIRLTEKQLKDLSSEDLYVRYIFYRDIVGQNLKTQLENQSRLLSHPTRAFTLPKLMETQSLPEFFSQVELDFPRSLHGETLKFVLEVQAYEKEYSEWVFPFLTSFFEESEEESSIIGQYPYESLIQRGPNHMLISAGIWLAMGAIFALVLFVLFSLIRYYRPSKCESCGQFTRKKDQACLHCEKDVYGHLKLVGKNTTSVPQYFALTSQNSTLGTHKSCRLRLPLCEEQRSLVYCLIQVMEYSDGKASIKISNLKKIRNLNIKVNQSPLVQDRLLKYGDKIDVPGHVFTLLPPRRLREL